MKKTKLAIAALIAAVAATTTVTGTVAAGPVNAGNDSHCC